MAEIFDAGLARQYLTRVFRGIVNRFNPERAIRRYLRLHEENVLYYGDNMFVLKPTSKIFVVGAGKASREMAAAVDHVLKAWPQYDTNVFGVVNVKGRSQASPPISDKIRLVAAGHPEPDEGSVSGAKEMHKLLSEAGPDDVVIAVISGGGSALMAYPAEGITLEDLKLTNIILNRAAVGIENWNKVRGLIDRMKKGNAALAARGAGKVINIMLSDVPGDKIDVIASGPFTFNTASYEEARSILEEARSKLVASGVLSPDQSPDTVLNFLREGEKGQQPLPLSKALPNVANRIVGSNTLAVHRVAEELRNAGYMVHGEGVILDVDLKQHLDDRGDTPGAFTQVVELLNRMRTLNGTDPIAIVMGGEPNVDLAYYEVTEGQGYGGRMQMFAAKMAAVLDGQPEVGIFVATDGSDHKPPPGMPVVAGAVVDGLTQLIAKGSGLLKHIAAANPYEFHRAAGTHLVFPEVTNVLDVMAIVHGLPAGVAEALGKPDLIIYQ